MATWGVDPLLAGDSAMREMHAGVVSTARTSSTLGEDAGSIPASRSVFSLVVIDDPVPMARPRVTVRGSKPHAYVPAKTQISGWKIRQATLEQLERQGTPFDTARLLFTGPVALRAEVYVRMPKSMPKRLIGVARPTTRPDLDRYLNTLMDGLSPLWDDDSQVVRIQIDKWYAYGVTPPKWVIEVEAL